MPQQDKIKYFNFLLENDINFSRDEAGNYVALVKVLNPAFYGGNQERPSTSVIPNFEQKKKVGPDTKKPFEESEDRQDTPVEGKPRSSSQAAKIPKNNSGNFNPSSRLYQPQNRNDASAKKIKSVKNTGHFEKDKKVVRFFT